MLDWDKRYMMIAGYRHEAMNRSLYVGSLVVQSVDLSLGEVCIIKKCSHRNVLEL